MEQIKPTKMKSQNTNGNINIPTTSRHDIGQKKQFLNELVCEKQNKVTHVCCGKDCQKNAFMCSDEDCKCGKKHQECVKFSLKKIVQKMQKKVLDLTPLIQDHHKYIDQCIDALIDEGSKIKDSFQEFVRQSLQYCQLSFEQFGVLESLQKKSVQSKKIKGKQFYTVHRSLFDKQRSEIIFNIQEQGKRISDLWKSCQKQTLTIIQKCSQRLYQSKYIDQKFIGKVKKQQSKPGKTENNKSLGALFETLPLNKKVIGFQWGI